MAALADIPEVYREPMILFYREEQSVVRVADALELSQDAVKQRLFRGRKMLQQQLAATVQTALENSKPAKAFAGAVVLGLSGAKAKTATAGIVASAATKTAAASSTGAGGMFLMPIAQLPVIAWLFKTAWDETRSPRERQLMIRHSVLWMLATALLAAMMFATLPWHSRISSPVLRAMIIPGMLILFYIPMVTSFRRLGKRIEQLRVDENTATPLRAIFANKKDGNRTTRLFVGSGLMVALWPTIMPMAAGDWASVGLLLSSAVVISVFGMRVCGTQPVASFRGYAFSLAAIALVGIGVMFFRRETWSDTFSNHLLWYMGTMQAMAMTHVILTTVVWKRVHGKPN